MISFFLALIILILTVPLKSVISILKLDIKRMDRKGRKQSGKKGVKSKLKLKRDKNKVNTSAIYKLKKKMILALKSVVALLKGTSAVLSIVGLLVIILLLIVVVIIMTAIGGVISIIMNNNNTNQTYGNNVTTVTETKKNKDAKDASADEIDKWLSACKDAWNWQRAHKYPYEYGATRDSKEYGTIRLDCSGYVNHCLKVAGYIKKKSGAGSGTSDLANTFKNLKGWKVIKWTKGFKIKRGDVLIHTGHHTMIYAGSHKFYDNSCPGKGPKDRGMPVTEDSRMKEIANGVFDTVCRLKQSEGVTSSNGLKVPLYYQGDYKKVKMIRKNGCKGDYPSKSIASSGCGFCSIAMVMSYYEDKRITPKDVLKKCGVFYAGSGMKYDAFKNKGGFLSKMGLSGKYKTVKINSVSDARKYGNKPLIFLAGPGIWTHGGHYIVVRGIDDKGKCYVNDSNGRMNARRSGFSAEKWFNKKFDFEKDVWKYLRNGVCYAIVKK